MNQRFGNPLICEYELDFYCRRLIISSRWARRCFFVCVYIYLSSIFYWNVKFTVLLLHVHLNCFFFTIQKCISLYGPYLSVFLRQMRWLSNKFTFRTARFCVHSHIHTHTHTHRNCTVESDFSAKRTTASHMC